MREWAAKRKGTLMKVIVDGNEVECLNDVTIIFDEHPIMLDGPNHPEETGQVHVKATHEGIILDVFDEAGDPHRTSWREPQDLLDLTH